MEASAASLADEAFLRARAAHGYVVTYSPKVFIPLTKLCRDRCGYCTFAQAPAHVASAYMSLDEVMAVAQAGRDAGCTEALFTLGERPELRYDEAARWLAARGYRSTVDYVATAAQMVLEINGPSPPRERGRPLRARARAAAHRERLSGHDARSSGRHSCASPRARQGAASAVSRRCDSRESCRSPLRRDSWSVSTRPAKSASHA